MVGERGRWVGAALSRNDGEVLTAAAYLHDVGYTPALIDTGLHSLDGARYLASIGHRRLASLVAHHSSSWVEAQLCGHADEFDKFPRETSAVADALTYCDMTVGSRGEAMTLQQRVADVEDRYGCDHVVTRAVREALPELSGAVERTENRLRAAGLLPDPQAITGSARASR